MHFQRLHLPTTDMNYNVDDTEYHLWSSLEVLAGLPHEDAAFDEVNAWSGSSRGLAYDSNESLSDLAQFVGVTEGLDQECLWYSSSIDQRSGDISREGYSSAYEPLKLFEPTTSPLEYSYLTSSSLPPAVLSPIAVPEAALQPLVERIKALEAAQSGTQASRSCSQGCATEDKSTRPIARIAHTRISRSSRVRAKPSIHKCKYLPCDVVASSSKDMKRHELQVHEKPGVGMLRLGWYACRCFYLTSRKDDLKRHFRTCNKQPLRDTYACRCLGLFTDRHDFEKHFSTCGGKLRGRPKQSSVSATMEIQSNQATVDTSQFF